MKKRILFVVTYLDTGGISRSLQNFLNQYDTTLFDIDVFALVHQGAFKGILYNCTMLPKNHLVEASVAHYENQRGWGKIESLIVKLLDKVTHYSLRQKVFKSAGKKLLKQQHYDAVVGFSEGLPTRFVAMMNHNNKIGWIHCDYANYLRVGSGKSELHIYDALKSIVCVSEFTREAFVNIYPSLEDKTIAIYNIIDDEMMKEKAKESMEEHFDSSRFNIVSIGRIDPVKRLSIVPELARKVVDAGCDIRWYVIGPKGTNTELQLLRNNIVEYNVENIVIPLGEKANPYPYISNADLLVNTSISEACPYVINEAKILRTPVVCTDFGSAKEFIDYGKNGYYEPIEKIPTTIETLVKDPQILEGIRCNLSYFKYENRILLQKIYSLFDSKKTSSN